MSEEMLIISFHALWDSAPFQVRLIRADHMVLAVNRAGKALGALCGVRCCDNGNPAQHVGCMAQAALEAQKACWGWNPAGTKLRFWIPVEGTDCYVHYSLTKEQIGE